jgi:hypothetical protein
MSVGAESSPPASLPQGFLNTLAGRSSGGVVLPLVGPAGMVEYIQRGFAMSRPDMHVIVQVVGRPSAVSSSMMRSRCLTSRPGWSRLRWSAPGSWPR